MLENYQSPWMDEELVIMRDAVRKFLDKEFVPLAEKWDKHGFVDRDAWYKAGDAGILCASISEELGGGGGDFRSDYQNIDLTSRTYNIILFFPFHANQAMVKRESCSPTNRIKILIPEDSFIYKGGDRSRVTSRRRGQEPAPY